ncbi:MAG TPA: hypothetical protein DDW52_24600 [Planctomycetaceae bacterium]|nr:hypothetical protein [Planctomycetaceae bacterium]
MAAVRSSARQGRQISPSFEEQRCLYLASVASRGLRPEECVKVIFNTPKRFAPIMSSKTSSIDGNEAGPKQSRQNVSQRSETASTARRTALG